MLDDRTAITCPACGETVQAPVYTSVNVTANPAHKRGVLDGELFTCTCPICGQETRLVYPFLYHDMQKRVMLYFCPEGFDVDLEELNEQMEYDSPFGGSGYTLRNCVSYEMLLEKIRIFDMELDDRVVELCKLVLMDELAEEHPELDVKRALIDVRGEQIYIAFIDVDGDVFAIELPDDVYNRIYDLYFDVVEEYTDEGFALIDSDWAVQTARYALFG